MRTLACLNGEIKPVEETYVPVWDRGFLFADSIYEVYRIYQGRLWLEHEHRERLKRSLREVEFPPVDIPRLDARVAETLARSEVQEGIVYIQITRGVAPRSHPYPDPPAEPTELIVVKPYDDAAAAKLRETGVAGSSQPDLRWGRCDIKTTNLLANVMALEHARGTGAYEAILVDRAGLVTEATHSSLLWVRNGTLYGTPEGPEILPGTKRRLIEQLSKSLGVPTGAERISLEDLTKCDEVMFSGTTIELLPVVSIDGRTIGAGVPGPVARGLQKAFREAVAAWLARV